jgi:hypothetical protein
MHQPPKRKKRKKGREPESPAPMSLKDKLQIWAWLAGCGIVLLLYLHFVSTRQQRIGIDEQIDRWRRDFHLTEVQAQRIRDIEFQFHGSGNPLTRPAHTRDETREHHRAMAAVMNPEDGERFFKAQEGSGASR